MTDTGELGLKFPLSHFWGRVILLHTLASRFVFTLGVTLGPNGVRGSGAASVPDEIASNGAI